MKDQVAEMAFLTATRFMQLYEAGACGMSNHTASVFKYVATTVAQKLENTTPETEPLVLHCIWTNSVVAEIAENHILAERITRDRAANCPELHALLERIAA